MPYVVPADFRTGSLQSWTIGLALNTAEASDPAITAKVAECSALFDEFTNDHYEPEPAVGATTLLEDSVGGTELLVRKRMRSLTQVETRNSDGTWSIEDAAAYRFEIFTGDSREIKRLPIVSVVQGHVLVNGRWQWPIGRQVVRLTGMFSWLTTPDRVKRAVSLMVWDHFKSYNPDIRRSVRWATSDQQFERAAPNPTGIPEVDEIVAEFSRSWILVT